MKKKILSFALLVVILSCLLTSCLNSNPGNSKDTTISLEEFNKIKTGMSYSEVVEIIGTNGELMSEVSILPEYTTQIYTWKGNGSIGANANVTFQGGKVISKAQVGLK